MAGLARALSSRAESGQGQRLELRASRPQRASRPARAAAAERRQRLGRWLKGGGARAGRRRRGQEALGSARARKSRAGAKKRASLSWARARRLAALAAAASRPPAAGAALSAGAGRPRPCELEPQRSSAGWARKRSALFPARLPGARRPAL